MTEDEKIHDLFDRTDHPPREDYISPELRADIARQRDEFLALEHPEPPKYRGKMKPGEFEILAHGSGGYHTLLEFLDIHPDLADWIEEEPQNLGRDLDDLGWDGEEFEDLMVIRCQYTTTHQPATPVSCEDYETHWTETSRRRAFWRTGRIPLLELMLLLIQFLLAVALFAE